MKEVSLKVTSKMDLSTSVFYGLIAILSAIVYYIRNRMNYWKVRGVPHDEPNLFFGNMKGVTRTFHQSEIFRAIYSKYKGTGPFCGIYLFLHPAVLVLDQELIKKVLVKDFNSFEDRGIYYNEKDDPLSAHLFAVDGGKWRKLRSKLSPTFSSAKMKFMFPTVVEVGHRFAEVFGEFVDKGSIIEIKEICARYTTDVIGTCSFGIECNSLTDPNAEFRVYGRMAFVKQRYHPLIMKLMPSCPSLARRLGLKVVPHDVNEFFMDAVRKTIDYREKNDIKRNDFMNILIDLKNNKPIETDDGNVLTGLTMDEVAAQAFVFYLAGFETSSSTLSYALYELAKNIDVQNRLRAEVNDVCARHKGELTYEGIGEMDYMNQVIDETLRMYSIITALQRVATEDYDTGSPTYKIEKGTLVFIPIEAIHYDPDIYPNPKKFDPERFTLEEGQKRQSTAWLPFGEGPRNCIGLRFGKMQTKIGLAVLIKNFKFSTCEKTRIPLQFDLRRSLLLTKSGIYLKVERV